MEFGVLVFFGLMVVGLLFAEKTEIGAKLFSKIYKALDMDIEPNWED